MAKFYEQITDELRDFIQAQHVFFVASAPLNGGHVNLSPKGIDSFRVLSASQVAYLDLTGSGNETSAHLLENGRITIMFCAFEAAPRILRLYGQGRTVLPDTPDWEQFAPHFTLHPGTRQIIVTEVAQVQTSCGFGVPLLDFVGERDQLIEWADKKGVDGLQKYRAEKNVCSIDALPTPLAAR